MTEGPADNQVSLLDSLFAPPRTEPRVWTVSEISKDLRSQLKSIYDRVCVRGEICDFKGIHRSGHLYIGIKDETAQLRVVMWKGSVNRVPFEIKGGLDVVVTGTLDYYGAGASLQLVAESIEPLGIGTLQLRFEQLKEKLAKEGLFAPERKRPLPITLRRIALVTGRSTAALQDMLRVFAQRYPVVEIFLFHATVQGECAPSEVVRALKNIEKFSSTTPMDLVILARGGGSYEDLFCFNDERLVRALAASPIPTISAIGHEIDFTISDFVADHRSATPTHAAIESTPDLRVIQSRLQDLSAIVGDRMAEKLQDAQQRLDNLLNRFLVLAPHRKLREHREILKLLQRRFQQNIERYLQASRSRLHTLAAAIDALSPLKIMERGYSLVQTPDGAVVRSALSLQAGQKLNLQFHVGGASVEVLKINLPRPEIARAGAKII